MCLCTLLQAVRLLFQTALMLMFGFDSVLVPAGLLAIETAAQVADVPSNLLTQPEVGAKGGRRAPRKRISGIMPEHMLYWVSQADIAVLLRCDDSDEVASMAK